MMDNAVRNRQETRGFPHDLAEVHPFDILDNDEETSLTGARLDLAIINVTCDTLVIELLQSLYFAKC